MVSPVFWPAAYIISSAADLLYSITSIRFQQVNWPRRFSVSAPTGLRPYANRGTSVAGFHLLLRLTSAVFHWVNLLCGSSSYFTPGQDQFTQFCIPYVYLIHRMATNHDQATSKKEKGRHQIWQPTLRSRIFGP
jgi:hypothetical protein